MEARHRGLTTVKGDMAVLRAALRKMTALRPKSSERDDACRSKMGARTRRSWVSDQLNREGAWAMNCAGEREGLGGDGKGKREEAAAGSVIRRRWHGFWASMTWLGKQLRVPGARRW
jgi:hypothetical protein